MEYRNRGIVIFRNYGRDAVLWQDSILRYLWIEGSKKLKKFIAITLAAVMTAALAACGGSSSTTQTTAAATEATESAAAETQAETMTMVEGSAANADPLGLSTASTRFKVGISPSMSGAYAAGALAFRNKLEELSNGEMTVDIYAGAALGNESDMLDAVSMGTLDMLITSTGPIAAFSNSTANWAVLDLPYLFPSYETAYEVLDGEVGQLLLDGFNGTGVKAFVFYENGYRCTTNSSKEIIHPEDLKGMKIRTMENKVHMATYSALGAIPTAMAMSEVFTALQQGTIDGQENPLSIIYYGNKLHEIQHYITENNLFYSPAILCMSQDIYDGLSEEQQAWIDEAAIYSRDQERLVQQRMCDQAREDMSALGNVINEVDQAEWIEATKSVYEDSSLGIDQDLLAKVQAVTNS